MNGRPRIAGILATAVTYLGVRAIQDSGPELGIGDTATTWPSIVVAGLVGATVFGLLTHDASTRYVLGAGYLTAAAGCILANGILILVLLVDMFVGGNLFAEGAGTAGFLVLITLTTAATVALYSLVGTVIVAPAAVIASRTRGWLVG